MDNPSQENAVIEWYEDGEAEIDFKELNKKANINRYTNAVKYLKYFKN